MCGPISIPHLGFAGPCEVLPINAICDRSNRYPIHINHTQARALWHLPFVSFNLYDQYIFFEYECKWEESRSPLGPMVPLICIPYSLGRRDYWFVAPFPDERWTIFPGNFCFMTHIEGGATRIIQNMGYPFYDVSPSFVGSCTSLWEIKMWGFPYFIRCPILKYYLAALIMLPMKNIMELSSDIAA